MGKETSKAYPRRLREGYFETVFVGQGIDIGSGDDPVTPDCLPWDLAQGDAQELSGVPRERFDWVYSSHCLEDLPDPARALSRWWEVLKPNGKLLLVVPDEDLYEQGCWPSRYNGMHRWTFTIHKTASWSPVSINLTELIAALPGHKALWFRLCDTGYDYSGGVWDRTAGAAEAHIEVCVQKLTIPEGAASSGVPGDSVQQRLWEWWGQPEHPAEWDGRNDGGGKGSQRFWEYLWVLNQMPSCQRVLDVGAGSYLFLPDVLTDAGKEVWAVDPLIPPARQNARYRAQTLAEFLAAGEGRRTRFDWVTCVSVLEHIEDKEGFCRDLDALQAPIALTFELAYEAKLVTMPMVYSCLAQFQNHYLTKMEVCPVWADNSWFGQWRPLGVVLDVKK